MAEENKSSKGIGELFVEFGSKGLPKFLKNLNTVSAQFLLTKNAAEQFLRPIIQTAKEAGNTAVNVGKMSSAFGITLKEAMKLQQYFKQHNLSEGLIQDLTSISDMLTKVQLGIGGISGEFAYAMHRMGLDWTDYDGSMESMIRLTNDVKKATKDLDANTRRVMMNAVGLQPEWSYAFERGDFNLDDYKTISDAQIEELINTQEAMADAGAKIDQLKMHLVQKLSPAVETVADWLGDKAEKGIGDTVSNIVEDNAGIIGGAIALTNPLAGAAIIGAGNIAKMQRGLGGTTGNFVPMQFGATQMDFGVAPWIKNKNSNGQATGGAANITPEMLSSIQLVELPENLTPLSQGYKDTLPNLDFNSPQMMAPSNTSNMQQTNNVQIINNNTINGADAENIGNRVTSLSAESYNQSLLQFQGNNSSML